MKALTFDFMIRVFPNADKKLIQNLLPYFNLFLPEFNIVTPLQTCHFLAQAAHETDSFKTLTEYASGAAYEGRTDLGNLKKGDGVRFKGRGIFQVTGRANYTNIGRCIAENPVFGNLRFDFADDEAVKNPELLAVPMWSVATACIYWQDRKLSALCKPDNETVVIKRIINGKPVEYECSPIEAITRRINGGMNGFAERKLYYERLKKELL